MKIIVEAKDAILLRSALAGSCGELVKLIDVQLVRHGSQAQVTLRLSRHAMELVIDSVMLALPWAQFGRLSVATDAASTMQQLQ